MSDIALKIALYANVILLIYGAWLAYKYMPPGWLKVAVIAFLLSGAGFISYGLHIQRDDVAIFHRK
jgi:hypothetical protein